MKVLVVAHRLELGGTQVNAIELAAQFNTNPDVDVVFAAAPGPNSELARASGLDLRPLPDATRHPSRAVMAALAELADEERPDLVHVWDWPQCFDAYPGLHLRRRLPMLCSIMSMVVPRNIPRHLETTFGTVELAERARKVRSGAVHLLEPPVDITANRPGLASGLEFRSELGLGPDEILVAMVTRLEAWAKLEGLQRTLDAVEVLASRHPVRLVIVGEGTAREVVARRAAEVNGRHGREVVTLTGGMLDPRPAYGAADVMVGMGGSALRTMAFGVPLVVIGERGFSRVLDEQTLPMFLHQGWYGLGTGEPEDLEAQLERLVTDPVERKRLGELGVATIATTYDLGVAAGHLEQWYREAATRPVPVGRALAEAGRTTFLRTARSAQSGVRAAAQRLRPQR